MVQPPPQRCHASCSLLFPEQLTTRFAGGVLWGVDSADSGSARAKKRGICPSHSSDHTEEIY